jgi:hypothetical protein
VPGKVGKAATYRLRTLDTDQQAVSPWPGGGLRMLDQRLTVRPNGSASTAELVSQAASQISTLVRGEIALGKAELMEKGKRAGVGGGLLGGAGVLAIYGVGLLLALFVALLDLVLPLWLAILVVMVVVFAAAAIAGLIGKKKIESAGPAVPQETASSVQADLETVKVAFREGRR